MNLKELIEAATRAIMSGQANEDTLVVDNDMREILSLVLTTDEHGCEVIVATAAPHELD